MKQILILLTLIFSICANAQIGQKNFIDQNYIEVNGNSEIKVTPDKIFLKIVINEKEHKGKTVNEVEKAMADQLTGIGVDLQKQLVIRDFMSNLKSTWILKSEIQSIKQYELLVYDAQTVALVFKELNELNIPNISINRLENSEIEKHKKEAKVKAIQQAKENAEALAQTIGQEIGRALLITEEEFIGDVYGNQVRKESAIKLRGYSSGGWNWPDSPDIEFEKINIEYRIKVFFELK